MEDNKYELVKFIDNELELEVNVSPKEETIWLSQGQMSLLFNVDRTRITRHISNIFEERELDEINNVRKTHFIGSHKPTTLYSLDVIISVGYISKIIRRVILGNKLINCWKIINLKFIVIIYNIFKHWLDFLKIFT